MSKTELDLHRATAAKIFNVRYEDVTPDQRRVGKQVNFAKVYGMGDRIGHK